ncbi:hypothetical protein ABC347_10810 [Sphingomonas sp. 1P06PA]|uniref:hypothetical protein n=1 Tax=Sphingomonas sp. 1P06PA TaxID=554121 RepID=UPI0039A67090
MVESAFATFSVYEWVDLAARLREACDPDGKPRGNHFIAPLRAFDAAWSGSANPAERNTGGTSGTLAAALVAEGKLFDDLRAVALEAAVQIERMLGSKL